MSSAWDQLQEVTPNTAVQADNDPWSQLQEAPQKQNVGLWGGLSMLANNYLPSGNVVNDINSIPSIAQGTLDAVTAPENLSRRISNYALGTKVPLVNDNIPIGSQSPANPMGIDPSVRNFTSGTLESLPFMGLDAAVAPIKAAGAFTKYIPGITDATNAITKGAGKTVSGLNWFNRGLLTLPSGGTFNALNQANDPNSNLGSAFGTGAALGAGSALAAKIIPPVASAIGGSVAAPLNTGRQILKNWMDGQGELGPITAAEFQANRAAIPPDVDAPIGEVANSGPAKDLYQRAALFPFSGAEKPYIQINNRVRNDLNTYRQGLNYSQPDIQFDNPLNTKMSNLGDYLKDNYVNGQLYGFKTELGTTPGIEGVNANLSNLGDIVKQNYLQNELTNFKGGLNSSLTGADLDKQIYDEYNQSYQQALQNEKGKYADLKDAANEVDSQIQPQIQTQKQVSPLGEVTQQQISMPGTNINSKAILDHVKQIFAETDDPQNMQGIGGFLSKIGQDKESNGYPLANLTNLLDLRQAINKRFSQVLSPEQGYQRSVLGGLKSKVDDEIQNSAQNYPEIQDKLQAALQAHKETLPFEQIGLGRNTSVSPFKKRYDTNINANNASNGMLADYFTPSQTKDSARGLDHLLTHISPDTASAIQHSILFRDSGKNLEPSDILKRYNALGDSQKELIFGNNKNYLDQLSNLNKNDLPLSLISSLSQDTKNAVLRDHLFGKNGDNSTKQVFNQYQKLDNQTKDFLLGSNRQKLDSLINIHQNEPSLDFLKKIITPQQKNDFAGNYLFGGKKTSLNPSQAISRYQKVSPKNQELLFGENKPLMDQLTNLKGQFPEAFQVGFNPKTGFLGAKGGILAGMLALAKSSLGTAAGLPLAAQGIQRGLRSDFLKDQYLKALEQSNHPLYQNLKNILSKGTNARYPIMNALLNQGQGGQQ